MSGEAERRWRAAWIGLAVAAACAGCATTSADFRMASVGSGDAAIAGRFTILYNSRIFNENCRATFGGRSIQLSQDGIVLFRVAKGWTALQRLDCKDSSNQHIGIFVLPGEHNIVATKPGFLPATRKVVLVAGQPASYEIRLFVDPWPAGL